ncbi:MAG: hypothetical protein QNJ94_19630 [Alphaproteobacteria bacterium]|nr:hypothetical protein [Alphaproteobacteria bacterium]
MRHNYLFSSLTRITDFSEIDFEVEPQGRGSWQTGDYVVGLVNEPPSRGAMLELTSGRMIEVTEGDLIVGAFGNRFATLELTGDWKHIGEDGRMTALTGAGIFGKVESKSPYCSPPIPVQYQGHVMVQGKPARMRDYAHRGGPAEFTLPIVLLVGSSMSAGKTTSAKIIIRRLTEMGLTVIGAKLTGAGRYRDILGMLDAGAMEIFDFVDVGLPSTVCPEDEYRDALQQLMSMMAGASADVLVAEAGASPLEPYNGAVAVAQIDPHVRCMVLCASDPYSVLGVIDAFGRKADLVAGMATSTEAGVALIDRLSGLKALNLMDDRSWPELDDLLKAHLDNTGAVAPGMAGAARAAGSARTS